MSPTDTVGGLLAKLKQNYAAELGSRIDDIELHILKLGETAHFQETVRLIHSMKGTAGTYGFMQVSTICHHLEDELATVTPSTTTNKDIDNFLRYVDLLRQVDGSLLSESAPAIDIDEALARLRRGQQLLRVVLVDGSKTIPAIIRSALDQPNIELKCMEDGYLALGDLLMQPCDLLITSEEIGSLNGRALISAVKNNLKTGQTLRTALLSSKLASKDELAIKPDYLLQKDAHLTEHIIQIVRDMK